MEAQEIFRRYGVLKGERDGHWLAVWREVRRYVMPGSEDYLSEGGVRGARLYTSIGPYCRSRLSAGIYSWLLDPNKRMFQLVSADRDRKDDPDVKEFFSMLTRKVLETICNSNYAEAVIAMLNSCAAGIDGVVFAEAGPPLKLKYIPVEMVCYQENSDGKIDTIFREIELTSRQIMEEFDETRDVIPEKIRMEAASADKQDRKHKILQAVFPRVNRDKTLKDNRNWAYANCYWLMEDKSLIRESGYRDFPFFVVRFYRHPQEQYGRGPGMDMLPEIRTLNEKCRSNLIATEKASDLDTLVPEGSMLDDTWDTAPGSVHIYQPGADHAKPEYMQYPVNHNQLAAEIEENKKEIKLGFYLDIFDPLGDLKQITATEAEIRNEGKLIPFSTIVGNVNNSFVAPLVQRVVGLLMDNGEIENIPFSVAENPEYKIEYISKITLAMKQSEAANWFRLEAAMQGILTRHPEADDNFDTDLLVRDLALTGGINPEWLRKEKDRDAVRQARNQQMQANHAMEQMAQGADLVPALSKAPEQGSLLDRLEQR